MTRTAHRRTQRGSSLLEILVVIVIFTVGILAAVQVYPGGLNVLRANRSNSVANALNRAEMERLKNEVEQMPVAVLPLTYAFRGTYRELELDLQKRPTDLMPTGATGLSTNGIITDADGGIGKWQLYSGANVARYVVGEGRRIPGPRFVQTATGTEFGGVMNLQFAPVFIETGFEYSDPSSADAVFFNKPHVVYGNDLIRRIVDTAPVGSRMRQDYTVFVDDEGLEMTVPQGPYRSDLAVGSASRFYRVSARVQYTTPAGTATQDLVRVLGVTMAANGVPRINYPVGLAALFAVATPGYTFERVEPDTLQVARIFEDVSTGNFLTEAQISARPEILDDAVYQYKRLNDRLGVLLFHPKGASYTERRNRGRFPLVAKVDYNVHDWRNLREDFRIPRPVPYQHKLLMESLKVLGNLDKDGTPNTTGIGFQVRVNGGGPLEYVDFLLLDRETGAVYTKSSYRVDKSRGIVYFNDLDNNPANGLTCDVIYSGMTTATRIPDVSGRSVRAIFQANGDFAVQLVKATTDYRPTFSQTLGFGQCYVGGTDVSAPSSLPTRLYFPLSDAGKKVIIGEAWYTDAGGNRKSLTEQEFIIRAPSGVDWGALAYVDLQEKDASAAGFDFSFGYALRSVRGASVTIRTTWNPSTFALSNDPVANLSKLNAFYTQTRRTSTETFLMKGAQE